MIAVLKPMSERIHFRGPRLTEGMSDGHLNAIYSDPYIARVGHDNMPARPIAHSKVTYLSAWVGGSFAGGFMVVRGSVDYELHALLKRGALPWSRELGRLCLDWAFANPIIRVSALVTDAKVVNYCLKLGFKREGIRRLACVRNGIACDVHILGMLRKEYGLCL